MSRCVLPETLRPMMRATLGASLVSLTDAFRIVDLRMTTAVAVLLTALQMEWQMTGTLQRHLRMSAQAEQQLPLDSN